MTTFCVHDYSKLISFKFNTVIGHHLKTWQEHFIHQNSWRHPGAILWSALRSTHDHIFITVNHFSFIFITIMVNIHPVNLRSINARVRVVRASARAKIKNAHSLFDSIRVRFFKHFEIFVGTPLRAHKFARAFVFVILRNLESPFLSIILPILFRTIWYHDYLFMTINNEMSVIHKVRSNPQLTHDVIMIASVQGKCPCVRALVIHSIYGQKHAYTKSIVAL